MKHHRHPSMLRTTTARLAVAGAASIAALTAVAPMAFADDDLAPQSASDTPAPTEDTASPETPAPTESTPTDEPTEATPTDDPTESTPTDEPTDGTPTEGTPTTETPAPTDGTLAPVDPQTSDTPAPEQSESADDVEVQAIFGNGKFRVGVQIADGSYVTDGTTTAGSKLHVTYMAADGSTISAFDCTTGPAGGAGSYSSCAGDNDSPLGGPSYFVAPDGTDSILVTQISAAPGLTRSTETIQPTCVGDGLSCSVFGTDATFSNKGLPPVTRPDSASTPIDQPIAIDVLANDDSDDPATTLTIGSQPSDGKAIVTGAGDPAPTPTPTETTPTEPEPTDTIPTILQRAASVPVSVAAVPSSGTLKVLYTPAAGFSGTDTFTYVVTNSNGSTTGTVTVDVTEAASAGPGTDDSDDSGSGDVADDASNVSPAASALPDTGGFDERLLAYGALLLAGGGALTVAGRRRPKSDALVD